MAVTVASPDDEVTSALWNELAGLINGTTGYGNPVSLTALSTDSFWSLTLRNQGALGQALRILNAAGNANLMTVSEAGVVMAGLTVTGAASLPAGVTLTAPILSVLTTNHDLLEGTGAGAVGRVGTGTATQLLHGGNTWGSVVAADLSSNLKTGYIPLPLFGWRKITSNDFGAIAVASGNGGQLATDTTPILQRINAATDKQARISWAAADVTEVQQSFAYPPDLDDTLPITVNLIVYKSANVNTTATIAVSFWEGVGDTNAGSATASITETVATQKTVSIAAVDVGAYPKAATVTLTPSAHASDAIYLLSAWVEYTRKS